MRFKVSQSNSLQRPTSNHTKRSHHEGHPQVMAPRTEHEASLHLLPTALNPGKHHRYFESPSGSIHQDLALQVVLHILPPHVAASVAIPLFLHPSG